ncbi:MAG: transketolase, partial [Actinomycetota bacterium]|nr:transketolase [Actinomycetota bacterium]
TGQVLGESDKPLDEDSWNVSSSVENMYSLVAGDELAVMGDEREDILVLTADLMISNRTGDFQDRHPDRFINVGIAEQNMVSMAAGLATCGYIPYVSTFASFASLLCAEQMRTDLAYPGVPVRVLAHHAGVAMGFYGTSHHAVEDIAITRAIANMTVVSAADASSLRSVLRSTLDVDGPVYIRFGRGREKPVYETPPALEHGRFVTVREGSDATIIATGVSVLAAVDAAEILAGEGIDVRVLDAVYIKPLDEEAILKAASETGAILVSEEHSVIGGLGGAVCETLARNAVAVPLDLHGLEDEYALIAPPTHLYRHYGFTGTGLAERMRDLLGASPADQTTTNGQEANE